jgi:hypothetical protein
VKLCNKNSLCLPCYLLNQFQYFWFSHIKNKGGRKEYNKMMFVSCFLFRWRSSRTIHKSTFHCLKEWHLPQLLSIPFAFEVNILLLASSLSSEISVIYLLCAYFDVQGKQETGCTETGRNVLTRESFKITKYGHSLYCSVPCFTTEQK